jgi:hypothetical protein
MYSLQSRREYICPFITDPITATGLLVRSFLIQDGRILIKVGWQFIFSVTVIDNKDRCRLGQK